MKVSRKQKKHSKIKKEAKSEQKQIKQQEEENKQLNKIKIENEEEKLQKTKTFLLSLYSNHSIEIILTYLNKKLIITQQKSKLKIIQSQSLYSYNPLVQQGTTGKVKQTQNEREDILPKNNYISEGFNKKIIQNQYHFLRKKLIQDQEEYLKKQKYSQLYIKNKSQITYDELQRYHQDQKKRQVELNQKYQKSCIQENFQSDQEQNDIEIDDAQLYSIFCLYHFSNRQHFLRALRTEENCKFPSFIGKQAPQRQQIMNNFFIKKKKNQGQKLQQMTLIVSHIIKKGNSQIRSFKNFINNPYINPSKYKLTLTSIFRIMIRLLQKFMIEKCLKNVQKLNYDDQFILLICPLIKLQSQFKVQIRQTVKKLLSVIFDIEKHKLTKKQLAKLYYAFMKKLVQRQNYRKNPDHIQLRRQPQFIKYLQYYDQKRQPGFNQGLEKITQGIYVINKQTNKIQWSQQFFVQLCKILTHQKKYIQLKNQLVQAFQGKVDSTKQFKPHILKRKMWTYFRHAIYFVQYQFYEYCKISKASCLKFYQYKLLTLNQQEILVLVTRQDSFQTRLMILDYYIHNAYRQKKESLEHWYYPITYINYIVEAIFQYLELKSYMPKICKVQEEDIHRDYYIEDAIKQFKFRNSDIKDYYKPINKKQKSQKFFKMSSCQIIEKHNKNDASINVSYENKKRKKYNDDQQNNLKIQQIQRKEPLRRPIAKNIKKIQKKRQFKLYVCQRFKELSKLYAEAKKQQLKIKREERQLYFQNLIKHKQTILSEDAEDRIIQKKFNLQMGQSRDDKEKFNQYQAQQQKITNENNYSGKQSWSSQQFFHQSEFNDN